MQREFVAFVPHMSPMAVELCVCVQYTYLPKDKTLTVDEILWACIPDMVKIKIFKKKLAYLYLVFGSYLQDICMNISIKM
jgi:hypothetical protein